MSANLSDSNEQSACIAEQELKYWLALWRVRGVGVKTFFTLLEHFSSPKQVFSASIASLKKTGLSAVCAERIKAFDWDIIQQDLQWLKHDGCHVMCFSDADYPVLLKEIPDPPPILFIRGERALLSSLQVAVVGARNPSPVGLAIAESFSKSLVDFGLTVTSGLALGVDQAAHKGALSVESGQTIAVAATGLDRVYPARHRELAADIVKIGALVSEFPIGTTPQPGYFPRRNRIISGLSLGVLVVEAAVKSGSLVTAKHAMEQGRDVFAIPGSIHNPLARGCHHLIKQGAKLVETAEDILQELGNLSQLVAATPVSEEKTAALNADGLECSLTEEYQALLEVISFEAVSIDGLVGQSKFTAEEISSMLLVLELQGLVSSAPGGLFYRCTG